MHIYIYIYTNWNNCYISEIICRRSQIILNKKRIKIQSGHNIDTHY